MLQCIPAGSSREAISVNVLDQSLADVVELSNKYGDTFVPIIAGDFNGGTGKKRDFVQDTTNENFSIRKSQDKTVNERGIDLIDFCKQTGFVISNGRTGEDADVGDVCVTTNGCSVLDYVLCKICDYELIRKFVVGSPTVYLDHCQIEFDNNVHCIPPADVDNKLKCMNGTMNIKMFLFLTL